MLILVAMTNGSQMESLFCVPEEEMDTIPSCRQVGANGTRTGSKTCQYLYEMSRQDGSVHASRRTAREAAR